LQEAQLIQRAYAESFPEHFLLYCRPLSAGLNQRRPTETYGADHPHKLSPLLYSSQSLAKHSLHYYRKFSNAPFSLMRASFQESVCNRARLQSCRRRPIMTRALAPEVLMSRRLDRWKGSEMKNANRTLHTQHSIATEVMCFQSLASPRCLEPRSISLLQRHG
jgi:hypothetical protein